MPPISQAIDHVINSIRLRQIHVYKSITKSQAMPAISEVVWREQVVWNVLFGNHVLLTREIFRIFMKLVINNLSLVQVFHTLVLYKIVLRNVEAYCF